MEISEIRAVLEQSEFFNGLSPEVIARIAPLCRVCRHEAGETVYRQGGTGEELFVIAAGQIVLERTVDLGARRGTLVVATLGEGRVFGGWSTLLAEPHRLIYSAVSRKPSRLLALNGAALRGLMTADVRLGFTLLEKLCLILRERLEHTLGAVETI